MKVQHREVSIESPIQVPHYTIESNTNTPLLYYRIHLRLNRYSHIYIYTCHSYIYTKESSYYL